MASAPVVHFEIGSADGDRARRFYGELFGWTVTDGGNGYGIVDTGAAAGIGGGILRTPEGVAPYVTFYVGVDDIEKALGRADELGAHRLMGPMPVGEMGEMGMFTDPDGNVLGLFTERSPRPGPR